MMLRDTRTRLIRPRPQGAEICERCGYLGNSTGKDHAGCVARPPEGRARSLVGGTFSLMVIRLQADNQLEHRHLAKNADKQLMMICTISAGNQCKT